MTRDDIIKLAREVWGDDAHKPWSKESMLHLERFAALVAQHEREACAKVCEARSMVKGGEVFAAKIRARGGKEQENT